MVKTVFLMPERDNENRPFRRGQWKELHNRLLALADGFNWTAGVHGVWMHEGKIYSERCRRYEASMRVLELPKWLEIVQWAKAEFGQIALYLEINGAPEII